MFDIFPEIKWSKKNISDGIMSMINANKSSMVIVMAEGAGSADELAEYLKKTVSIPVRVSKIGYIQRGGSPTVDSRLHASVFGYEAVKLLKSGKKSVMLTWSKDKTGRVPLSYPNNHRKKIDLHLLKIASVLCK